MSELLVGSVVSVESLPVGAQLDAAGAVGAATLTLDDAAPFYPLGGQFMLDDGTVLDYDSADAELQTLTLTSTLVAALVTGARLQVLPAQVEVTALVLIDDESEPIPATVPVGLQDVLTPGMREVEAREQVSLAADGDFAYTVADIVGEPLQRNTLYTLPQGCSRYQSTSVAVSSGGGATLFDFNTLDYDTNNYAATSLLTVPRGKAGLYQLTVRIPWTASSVGRRLLLVNLNSSATPSDGASDVTVIAGDNRQAPSGGVGTNSITESLWLQDGDALRVWVAQNSGASLNVSPGVLGGAYISLILLGGY